MLGFYVVIWVWCSILIHGLHVVIWVLIYAWNVPLEMDLRWIVEKFYCSVRSAWTVNFHGNSVLIGNRYEEMVFSRVIYHMSRLCIWNFIEKYWVLIIICYFTRKLCKSVNLTDSVFVGLKVHNKSNIWNLSDWDNFLESYDVYVIDGISPMPF